MAKKVRPNRGGLAKRDKPEQGGEGVTKSGFRKLNETVYNFGWLHLALDTCGPMWWLFQIDKL